MMTFNVPMHPVEGTLYDCIEPLGLGGLRRRTTAQEGSF